MKKLLLPVLSLSLSLGVFTSGALAEGPAGSTIYRPVPKANSNGSKSRFRVTEYVPTQFYYTRDSVISYHYTTVASYEGTPDSGSYLGPNGARFIPQEDELPSSSTVRSFASVTRRGQPGVGMVAPTPVKAAPKKAGRTKTTALSQESSDLASK